MIAAFVEHAPSIGLVFFFTVFLGIAVWALRPSNKVRFQTYGEIPLKEDDYGR